VAGYHPRRGGCYDSWEDRWPTPEPRGTRVFSQEISTANFPSASASPPPSPSTRGRHTLGYGSTTDVVIIRNLPLHLADSARTWLEHLPPSQIHRWNDLVHMFVGNF
jgi:hypothetical protein